MTLTTSPQPDDHVLDATRAQAHGPRGVPTGILQAARLFEKRHDVRRHLYVSVVILAIASLVDVALAKNAFDVSLRLPEWLSWFVAIGVGLIAVSAAFGAGIQTRRRAFPMAVAMGLAVVLIAAALYVLRAGTAAAGSSPAFETTSEPLTGSTNESILAPVMLLIFLAVAVLAFADGWRLSDPDRSAYWALTELLDETASAHADKTGRVVRLHEEISGQLAVFHRIDADRAVALAALKAVADELREWSRIEIARELGDPRSTSAIHNPA